MVGSGAPLDVTREEIRIRLLGQAMFDERLRHPLPLRGPKQKAPSDGDIYALVSYLPGCL